MEETKIPLQLNDRKSVINLNEGEERLEEGRKGGRGLKKTCKLSVLNDLREK